MATATTPQVSGAKLVEACGYDHKLCGAFIAPRKDWQELLDSIPQPVTRRNVAAVILGIREALGLDALHALEICQGHR